VLTLKFMSPQCSRNAWSLIILQISPGSFFLHSKALLLEILILTRCWKIALWFLSVKLNYKVALTKVYFRCFLWIFSAEKLRQTLHFKFMNVRKPKPFATTGQNESSASIIIQEVLLFSSLILWLEIVLVTHMFVVVDWIIGL